MLDSKSVQFTKQQTDSFFKIYKKITEMCEIEETLTDKNKIKEKLLRYFNYNNDENWLIDSIRTIYTIVSIFLFCV